MGNCATAHLVFGIFFKEDDLPESILDDKGWFDLDDLIEREFGYEDYKLIHAATKIYPVKIVYCGTEGYSCYVFCPNVENVSFESDWGEALTIDQLPEIDNKDINLLKAWCKKHDVPFTQPKWHLVASYG